MYVTTHLVRAKSGLEGINGFLHHHGVGFVWPDEAAPLADHLPGQIVRRRTDLPPGHNEIRAYLDVLAPDDTPHRELVTALDAFARDLDERRNPTVFTHGPVTIRFGVDPSLELIRDEQLRMLARIALELAR